jgi:hypothetical protein
MYQIFSTVTQGYAAPKYTALTAKANASQKQEDHQAVTEHSSRITAWTNRTQNPYLFVRLKTYDLKHELDDRMPKQNDWMNEAERKVAEQFEKDVLNLFDGCKKKGGYTLEAATFVDRFPEEREQVVQELFGEVLKTVK